MTNYYEIYDFCSKNPEADSVEGYARRIKEFEAKAENTKSDKARKRYHNEIEMMTEFKEQAERRFQEWENEKQEFYRYASAADTEIMIIEEVADDCEGRYYTPAKHYAVKNYGDAVRWADKNKKGFPYRYMVKVVPAGATKAYNKAKEAFEEACQRMEKYDEN